VTTGDKCSGAGRGAGGVQGGRHALSRLDEHGVADPGLALAGVDAPHATARAAGLPGVADRLGRLAVGAGVDPHSVKGPAVLGLLLLLEHSGSPERRRGGSLSPSHPYNVTRLGEIARTILSQFVSVGERPRKDAEPAMPASVDGSVDLGVLAVVVDEHAENVGLGLPTESGLVEGDAGGAEHSLSFLYL